MKIPKYLSILSLAMIGTVYGASPALATPFLGTAQSFAVLAGSTVTSTGPIIVLGDVGVWPGTAITGTGIWDLTGTPYPGGAVAQQAQADALTARNALGGLGVTNNLTGSDLGGHTLYPGVYKFDSSAQLTGGLTLDFHGHPNQPFVFQIGSTLTTATDSFVNVINGGSNSGVYWDVGSSATLGTGTQFAGNILALTSITLTTGTKIMCGRAIALNAAVTMDTNSISIDCNTWNAGTGRSDFGSKGFSGPAAAVPEPETYAMLLAGLGLLGFTAYRRKSLDV